MPGQHRAGRDPEPPGQLRVHVGFHRGERRLRQPFEFLEDRQQLGRIVFLQPDLHLPEIGKAQFRRRLVADLGQLDQFSRHGRADLFESLPDLLPARRIGLVAQPFEQVVIRQPLAVDFRAKRPEQPLDLFRQRHHTFQQVGRQLVAAVRQLGQLQRPLFDLRQPACGGAQLLDALESGRVAMVFAHCQRGGRGGREVLFPARVGRLPFGQIAADLQLGESCVVLLQERPCLRFHRLFLRLPRRRRIVDGTRFRRFRPGK